MDFISKRHNLNPSIAPLSNWPDKLIKFLKSDELEEMGEMLIEKFRPDLRGFKIGYLFKQKASKSGPMTTLGQAKRENDMEQVLHGYNGVIVIGFDTWKDLELDEKFRLIFHELAHFELDEKGQLGIADHTVQEFPEVVKIFGLGNDAQIAMVHAYKKFSDDYKTDLEKIREEESNF